MITPFKQTLTLLLKTDQRLLDSEGEIMINKIHDLVDALDNDLIELLLNHTETKNKFFKRIKDVYVFKTSEFKFYLDENKVDNSYTEFENRIGLAVKKRFIKDTNEVVLDFPFKDCILEGGQSTEEGLDTFFEFDNIDDHYIEKKQNEKKFFSTKF